MKRRGDPLEVGDSIYRCMTEFLGTKLEIRRLYVQSIRGNSCNIGLSMHPSSMREGTWLADAEKREARSPEEALERTREYTCRRCAEQIAKKRQEIQELKAEVFRMLCTKLEDLKVREYPADYEEFDF